jgi:hypothetical protein
LIVIDSSTQVYRDIQLLAGAWNVSLVDAVARLVDHYHDHAAAVTGSVPDPELSIHAVYGGVRVEGRYHRLTRR